MNSKLLAASFAASAWMALVGCGDTAPTPTVPTQTPPGGLLTPDAPGFGNPAAPGVAAPAAPGASAPEMSFPGLGTAGISGDVNPVDPASGLAGPGAGAVSGDQSFCAVKAILDTSCSRCHGAEPAAGAPMSLTSHADLMANSRIDGRPNFMVMLDRVKDSSRPMPPVPNPMLSPDQLAAVEAWVAAGTPDNAQCQATAGGAVTAPAGNDPSCIDCGDYVCDPAEGTPVQLLAHGQPAAGDTSPYDASTIGALGSPDLYQCFYFKAPWKAGDQSIGYRPIIDNSKVLHHWLLYASPNAPPDITDGGMKGACQLQGDTNRVLLAGWAPGTQGQNLPQGVGQELPVGGSSYVTLEVHYYNTNPGMPADDRSGVELCKANSPRPNVATQHWLGTENINIPPSGQATAGDTCTPSMGMPSTIISITPHMHKAGTHGKVELIRANGQREVILDEPFDFDNQITHTLPEPITIMPGDRLNTTCSFQNRLNTPVAFGEGSDEEMCYFFTIAYPAGSLHNGRNGCFLGACVPGGTTRCIDNENLLTAAGAL